MIKNMPHMIEKIREDDAGVFFDCVCGAIWSIKEGVFGLDEGNSICELPTIYDRWHVVQEMLRKINRAYTDR